MGTITIIEDNVEVELEMVAPDNEKGICEGCYFKKGIKKYTCNEQPDEVNCCPGDKHMIIFVKKDSSEED